MTTRITDGINFLSKLTLPRLLNGLGVLGSYYFSKITRKPIQWGMPVSISIEPTTSCNLRCPECPSGKREFTRPTGMLDSHFFRTTIDALKNELVYLIFYFQGEPYLNPSFLEMVSYASKNGIYTATSTNAHYLNDDNARKTIESGLDRLIISIDGTTQDTYKQYRVGGNLQKVLEGTKNIIKWKKKLKSNTPHIVFQFLVVAPNEHQIKDILQLGKNLGVDEVRLKTAQVYEYENGNPLIPSNKKYARYHKNRVGKFELKNKLLNHCWKLWHSCVISWDGLVVPCCFDKDAQHRLGDLKETPFKQIWKGKGYDKFRASVLRSRKEIDICSNCSEGSAIWA